ncbi:MAG TPA: hypothetical protein PLV68_10145, partial [Ilumatobacteraceae bacterium]|nr:hypothetical protein [Ilumatobacteraceae bacterium]
QLLDVMTGTFVPDGISSQPDAFNSECCGGYDYLRVEHAGSLAWSVSAELITVWFPSDSPGPGITVDLFGTNDSVLITPTLGWDAIQATCGTDPVCFPVRVAIGGLSPGDAVEVACWVLAGDEWDRRGTPTAVAVSPDGSIYLASACVVGAHEPVVVTVDGAASAPLVLDGEPAPTVPFPATTTTSG